jgi:hypothetical protein
LTFAVRKFAVQNKRNYTISLLLLQLTGPTEPPVSGGCWGGQPSGSATKVKLVLEKLLIILLLAATLAPMLVAWVVSREDDPNPRLEGYPDCSFRRLTGKSCPLCGGVASFVSAFRGDLAGAWKANPFAVVLLLSMVVLAAGLVVALFRPGSVRPLLGERKFRFAMAGWGLALLFLLVFAWLARL